MNVNLDLLCVFQKPMSIYEVSKCGHWSAYSGAFKAVKKLLADGLIVLVASELNEKNVFKKSYVLTEKGRRLLELFKDAKGGP